LVFVRTRCPTIDLPYFFPEFHYNLLKKGRSVDNRLREVRTQRLQGYPVHVSVFKLRNRNS
ncbi:hypothetical protein, partial [Odoribacter laneus]|uniref:hypothetical protein n=1 Tax=Odoribacter laneus TaxID=626933 RepID=UPI003991EFB4